MGDKAATKTIPLSRTTKFIVDNRGRTAPTAATGIALIATNCVSNDRLYPSYERLRFVSEETYHTWFRSHPRPGDILLTNKGSQNGAICLVPNPVDFVIAQDMVALRANEDVIDPLFLFAALRSPEVQRQIRNLDVSGVIPHFKKTDFDKLQLPYPDRITQEKIGRMYFELSAKIDLNRRTNETLEGIARAIFKSWFVDFDPVRAKAEGRQPAAMDAETAALFPAAFHPSLFGSLPLGWSWTQLGGELELLEVGSRPRGGAVSDGVPSIGAESIVGLGRFDYSKTRYVPQEFFLRMGHGQVQSGDVLVYKDGGRPGEYEPHVTIFGDGFPFERCCINEHVYRARAKSEIGQPYLYFWLTTAFSLDQMRIRGTGVAIPGLNSTAFRSIPLLSPKHAVCEAFNASVVPFLSAVFQNCKQSRTLTSLRDLLLPKLLSGELRIRDAEKMIESHI